MKTFTRFFFAIVLLLFFCAKNYAQKSPVSKTNAVQVKDKNEEAEEENEENNIEHAKQKWYKLMKQPNANYVKVKKKFDRYFRKHPFEGSATKEYGTQWLLQNLFYLDRRGRVQSPPATNYNTVKALLTPPLASVTDTMAGDWRMIGPRNSVQVGAGVGNNGGYGYCVRIDPTNSNKYFVSFVTGGLWVSSNGGNVWQLTDANLPDMPYYDIDVCKANSNYVYAINDSTVIKSTDGGLTWMPTALNSTNYPGGKGYDIAVSPSNPNIVLARWGTNVYRTADGGATWVVVQSGLQSFSTWDSDITGEVLDWHPVDTSVVYFTDRSDNSTSVDIYRSGDQGLTFTKITTLTPAITSNNITGWSKILTATNTPNAIYIAIGTGTNAYGHHAAHLYKIDATTGATLFAHTNMIDGVNQNYGSPTMLHHGDITMDINNAQNIVWGSYSQSNAQYSSDTGTTFKTSTTTIHADLRGVSMVNGKVLMGTDGSSVVSTDGGNNFSIVTNSISNHELWGFGSAFKSDILGAGCNHGPLMIRDYEAAGGWYSVLGADQGNTDVNPLDSVTVYSQGYDSYHVTRTGIKTFTNGGQQIDPGGIYAYFNSMQFHPNLYNTLITHHAGGYPSSVPQATKDLWKRSLIRSDDNGVTIDSIVHSFTNQVFREKICYTNPNYMYLVEGLTSNNLWKTTDAGATWTSITPPTTVTTASYRNISDIAVSDINPNEIWVTYSGVQNTCKVLHSTDGGATYTNLTTPLLTSFPITKIIFQRGTNGGVYVGSKAGIFYRNNAMTDWQMLGNGLPRVDVRFMFINYYKGNQGKLLIGTSRGAWDHDLYEHSNTMAQISANTATPSCQSPVVQFRDYSVVSSGGSGATYSWSFPGGTPSTSNLENPTVSYSGSTNGKHDVILTVTDQYGTNTQTLTGFISYDSLSCCQGAPVGWQFADIASTTQPGNLCYTAPSKNYKITTYGKGIGDTSDHISYTYTPLNGDGVIIARVKSLSTTYNYSAGIMLRNSLDSNSSFVYLNSLDTRGVFDMWRSTTNGHSTYQPVTSFPMPMWLKLQRKGNNIISFYSSDGTNWTPYHTYNVTFGTSIYAGLAVSGNNNVANIDSVYVGAPPPCIGGSANGCPALDTVPGRAASFNSYSWVPAPFTAPATNTFTITGWIKPNAVLQTQSSVVAWDNGYFFLSQNNDNQLGYDWNGNTNTDAWQSGLFAPANKWSFVAMVVRPDSATFYLNDKSATHVISLPASAITNPIFGNSNQGAGYYTGAMDELTIWNKALSVDQIDSLRHLTKENIANNQSPTYDPALIGYFQFNDSSQSYSYNQIDSSIFVLGNGVSKIKSTAPVGSGVSAKASVTGSGTYSFGNTGISLTFPGSGSYPNGNVWVTHINQSPDANPKAPTVSNAYWVINNYGIDSSFSSLSSVNIGNAMTISSTDAATPGKFTLFRRDAGADGNTWAAPVANASSATAGTPGSLAFAPVNISSQGQIVVANGFITPPIADTIPGSAFSTNGYPDKVLVNDVSLNNTNTITITGWVKPNGIQNAYSALLTNKATGTIFMVRNNNELGYQWNGNGWNWASGLTVPANQWSFVALVITPTTATLYLNNQKAAQTGLTNALINIADFCLAEDNRGYTNRSFKGQMDEITIWNRALSDDEIRGLKHLTKEKTIDYTTTSYDNSLVTYLQFNDASSTSTKNIVSGSTYTFAGSATKITSTVPIGSGVSAKATVSATGNFSFGNTGVSMGFHPGSTYPNGDIWVTKINQVPNSLPDAYQGSNKYWIVNNYGTNTSFTALDSIVFTGAINVSSFAPSAFKLYKRPDNSEGNTWGTPQAYATAGVTGTPGNLTFGAGNNITSFSQFYITSSSTTLPVNLISFTASKQAQTVLLNWNINNENNFGYYVVERSTGDAGNAFKEIGRIGSSQKENYSYVDISPASGVNYYRLKMVDANGKYTYSGTVSVSFNNALFVRLMPNPVTNNQPLKVQNIGSADLKIAFYLLSGAFIKQLDVAAGAETQVYNLPKGAIIYRAQNAKGESTTGKIIVE